VFTIRYPEDLPITARREDILAAIRGHQVVVLAGETGSGKTTQLPKMCLEVMGEARGQIGCTQPRRVAAMSVSKRVAEELNVRWGGLVGCKMRFSDDTSRDTKVKFMTDGILLAEIQSDPLLRAYSMLILDEAHERSLNIDFLLGYLKVLLPKRPDLKIVVTSATIDTELFSRHFNDAPIIEVSGRLYPVEIRYRAVGEDDEDPTHLDAAVRATEDVLIETNDGDVLIFMPTERDIREARDLLQGRLGSSFEVLALFGRMASQEQQRIFSPGPKRRVIIATNVAETSITVPRIAAVVDTGLARLSRYNPRTRTKRLPVEDVSQSSANQRAGRAGRVRDGLCIRLFAEDDYLKRPKFTQPEIQRSNLAEVILRMKAFKLGNIENFPFLQPPNSASVRAGYDLLHELGALSDTQEMTERGHELAALPLDPTLGRMLLQARQEGCLDDMLIIAAGMSIPDPRERPEDKKELANAAHKRFASPESDFMGLLKIWQLAPEPQGSGKNALRRFCRESFLSFTRMTEWRDVWGQLRDTFSDSLKNPSKPAENNQAALHRCILAGHLSQIGLRQERNMYKAAGNREVTLFPGSYLYERRDKNSKPDQPEKTKQPLWIVAAEIVQTSQLFARTVAGINPEWAAELGEHLLERRHAEPHWSAKAGRVLVNERLILHGLEVMRRKIDFGKIDPLGATQIFIRGALLEEGAFVAHRFFELNQKLRTRLEAALTRVRSSRVYAIEEKLFEFYRVRLHGISVSSIHDLNKLINERVKTEPNFLVASEADLTGGDDLSADLQQFPDQAALHNGVLPIAYAYKPGQEDDGVTVRVPLPIANQLTTAEVQWLVPGLREELILTLLRALPKQKRSLFMPLETTAKKITREFKPKRGDFLEALAEHLQIIFRADIKVADWPADCIPPHLRPRLEVIAKDNQAVVSSRDLSEVQAKLKKDTPRSNAWADAVKRHEKYGVPGWTFGDLPESILIEEIAGVPVLAYPGLSLRAQDREVDIRLFRTREEALRASPPAIRALAEMALGKDIAWLHKELRSMDNGRAIPAMKGFDALVQVQAKPAATVAPLSQQAQEHILAHALRLDPVLPLNLKRFTAMCETAKRDFPLLAQRVRDLLKTCDDLKARILASKHRYAGLDQDLARLLPPDVLLVTPHAQLQHLPRYLKCIMVRAERAVLNPAKDKDKAAAVNDFADWRREVTEANRETFRWLYEEYRVSIYAQELGTAQPVSLKRLEALIG
jgi:ATP-dependent helicase HrpA